jgi:transcriptional regulator with XRE-family HTH domain
MLVGRLNPNEAAQPQIADRKGRSLVKNPHLEELGKFLKARRSELTPADLGLLPGEPGSRRVSGLRREEVATAAAISHDYYSRIEQGRLSPSAPVLDVLTRVLKLTDAEREYVNELADHADRRTEPRRKAPAPRPQIQRLLNQLTLTPAFVVGKFGDYLAWNPLAGALLLDLDAMAPHERNYVRLLFADSRMKDYYADWESMARQGVARLRMQVVDSPNDPRLTQLVGELSIAYPLFQQWWADRHVHKVDNGRKTIYHPDLGEFTFDWDSYYTAGIPDQHVTVWSPEPGSPSEEKLRVLSSWIAQPAQLPENHELT